MTVYSYIGKEPVYSELFKCHIWTSPPPKITFTEIELSPETRRVEYRHIVRDCFATHGPLTARMVAEKTGLQMHQISGALNTYRGKMFLRLCDRHNIWGLVTQTIADVRFTIKPHSYDVIAEYLKTVEVATSNDIEAHTGIDRKSAVVAMVKHRELFQMVNRAGRAKLWKLKDKAKEAA